MLKKLTLIVVLFFIAATYAHASIFDNFKKLLADPSPIANPVTSPSSVLGSGSYNTEAPRVFINGGNNSYSSGGLITQAVTDEAGVFISGYQMPSQLHAKIYRASKDQLFQYLIHNKDYQQLQPSLDTSTMSMQGELTLELESSSDNYASSFHSLPIEGTGIWYIELSGTKVQSSIFILRSSHGVYTVEENRDLLFWGQKFTNLRSIGEGGSLKTYNFQDGITELNSTNFDNRGLAHTPLSSQADLAISDVDGDLALVPLNLTYLNTGYGYSQFRERQDKARYFTFTDRPIYLPGDKVYFKSVIRDDNDAKYTIPSGVAHVTLNFSGNEKIKEFTLPISENGSISGQIELPESTKTGYYFLTVQTTADKDRADKKIYDYGEYTGTYDYSSASFNVEYYRKPEATLEIESTKNDLIAGSPLSVDIVGSYYSGSPLMSQTIKYRVTAADYYEYNYLSDYTQYQDTLSDDYRYGGWYGSQEIKSGNVDLDKSGKGTIEIPTSLEFNTSGKSQVFIVEATLEDGSYDPIFARKNILVRAGQFGLFGTDFSWNTRVNQEFSLPVVAAPYEKGFKVGVVEVTAKLTRHNWNKVTDPNEKYPRYEEKIEELPETKFKTDENGKGIYKFTPTSSGSYQLILSSKDKLGNTVKKEFYFYASEKDYPYYIPGVSEEKLSLTTNHKKYSPGDTAEITINSEIPDRDVLLSFERAYEHRYELVKLSGKSGVIEKKILEEDQPNLFLSAASFSSFKLDSASVSLSINTSDKKMVVGLTPDKSLYGPGETVTVNISTTDATGKPVSAEVAVWTVDKAIFALTDNRLGDIFKTFWSERANSTSDSHSLRGILVQAAERGGGCFTSGTQITLANGHTRSIENIKIGDQVLTYNSRGNLVKASVSDISKKSDEGYLIINGTLQITPDHILNVNGAWRQASQIQLGDELMSLKGLVPVTSLTYQARSVDVYNLTVDQEHTFIADGYWVHNAKGLDRSVFKDVAFWNPAVKTGSDGRATITFKLPDNLTTWTIAGVGSNRETVVGQTSTDIQVNKDLVIKPIVPNLVRIGDKLTLSGIARNFTDKKDEYKLSLKIVGADVDDPLESKVTLDGKSSEQIYWRMSPSDGSKELKYTMGMVSSSNEKARDTVSGIIPIEPFGFKERSGNFKIGSSVFELNIPKDANNSQSKLSLELAPSLVTSLQSSMKYLLNYPYGCIEQLTSRLVPALLAKSDTKLFASALVDVDLDKYIKDGITKINDSHEAWSGWAWWSHGNINPFVTSYVLEAYKDAAKLGYDKETNVAIGSGLNYLKNVYDHQVPLTNEERITRRYGLSLFKEANDIPAPEGNLEGIDPDLLAMHVLTNVNKGDKNPETNGANILIAQAQSEGDSLYWKSGSRERLGSVGASTAWAIRALIAAGADPQLPAKGIRYLLKNKHNDYWYNSYATVEASRAILDLYHRGSESDPNYTYKVTLSDKIIASGKVDKADSSIAPINIPLNSTGQLKVELSGEGQLYSTLVSDLFRTDREVKAESHGISITREYLNDRKPDHTIGLGDIVRVEFTVSGLTDQSSYLVIEDQLPAGLVPIIESFKNEQFNNNSQGYYSYSTEKEYTKNGANLIVYSVSSGSNVYSYKARVVSMGKFNAPPAVTSLMYSPEVSGRTDVTEVVITSESKLLPGAIAQSLVKKAIEFKYIISGIVAGLAIIGAGIYFFHKLKKGSKDKEIPPKPLPQEPLVNE